MFNGKERPSHLALRLQEEAEQMNGDCSPTNICPAETPMTPCVIEVERLPSFTELDGDNSGGIELEEFKKLFPKEYPIEKIEKKFNYLDKDKNGILDRSEYYKIRTYQFAFNVILPKSKRPCQEMDRRNSSYKDLYSCVPPPIFMFIITLIEVIIFAYYAVKLKKERGWFGKYGPAPDDSIFIYDPTRRYEIWRFLTYMFVHSGYMHLINNVVMQLFLGILLELVHKWWRVLIIYFAGVLAGSLATSIVDPETYLAGASGGVYALIFAHLSTVILNWSEMGMPWLRVILFAIYAAYDIGVALYYNYILEQETNVGYAAHIGGGIAGLLIGIYVLKNINQEYWEGIVWWISVCILVVLTVFAIGWNVFKKDYYPVIKY